MTHVSSSFMDLLREKACGAVAGGFVNGLGIVAARPRGAVLPALDWGEGLPDILTDVVRVMQLLM